MYLKLWRQIFLVLVGSVALIWPLSWVGEYLLYRSSKPQFLNTNDFSDAGYLTDTKFAVFGRNRIDPKKNNIIFLGSSNVRMGFKPGEFRNIPEGWTVNNAAVGASNITELLDLIRLLNHYPLTGKGGKTFLVLGIWHGLFVDDAKHWPEGKTDLDVELIRYRMDATSPIGKWVQNFVMPLASRLVPQGIALSRARVPDPLISYEIPMTDPKKREAALQWWANAIGTSDHRLKEEQFIQFALLVKHVRRLGWKLLVVDLPVPSWHSAGSPYYADYQARNRIFLPQLLASEGASYLNLQEMNDPKMFYDSVHVRPSRTHFWADRLSVAVQRQLQSP